MKASKFKILNIIFFILLTIHTETYCSIMSIDKIEQLDNIFNSSLSDTLVIFDVDEVLITYQDFVLRPVGAKFRPAYWNSLSDSEITNLMSIILSQGELVVIEEHMRDLIKDLVNKNVPIIAFTAARTGQFGIIKNAENWRIQSLMNFSFDFSNSFKSKSPFYFSKTHQETNYSIFKKGILFLGDDYPTKGSLLMDFLKSVNFFPKKIIFIDDKISNLESVETQCMNYKIEFEGFEYRAVHHLEGILDEQTAELQFTHLKNYKEWLSDEKIKMAGPN